MNEPWFDPNLFAWIPGTVYGTTLGIFGGVIGSLASAGKAKRLCLGGLWVFTAIAVLLLVISAVAWSQGQPGGIWYAFGLPGVLGVLLCPSMIPIIRQRYRQAEERRMTAADIGRP